MTALVLDSGALIALERNDRRVMAMIGAAFDAGIEVRSNANVIAQVWRGGSGRQAVLARALAGIDVVAVDEDLGRRAGELLGRNRSTDVVDATVVLCANVSDRILTSDPQDIERLRKSAGLAVRVIDC